MATSALHLSPASLKALAFLRIALGWLLLWAFLDKVFGLGFATKAGQGWLAGASPTAGFLGHATHGPFAHVYQSLAGNQVVDWLFMLGLLGIGLALVLGIGLQIAGYSGMLLMALMFSSLLPPTNNPVIDEHVIYCLLFFLFAQLPQLGQTIGLGAWWATTDTVKRYPILR